mgnify:CR=1 FL=1|uniref:Uncharacterized protein n=1 Tax=viral metagenome TaxID=1070528 RepID=A0A6C0L1T3_9ZZZZ|tara:strand:- start:1446 stop:1661 length:216 start_codon:yes stop_codon:yes gene_type:complete
MIDLYIPFICILCKNEGRFDSRCYIKHNKIWQFAFYDGNGGFSLAETDEYVCGKEAICHYCYNSGFSKKID